MLRNREGESGTVPHRSGRLHCVANQWFFATRNGRLEGPYRDQDEAEAALHRFLQQRR